MFPNDLWAMPVYVPQKWHSTHLCLKQTATYIFFILQQTVSVPLKSTMLLSLSLFLSGAKQRSNKWTCGQPIRPSVSTRSLSGAIMTSFWWGKQRYTKWTCGQPVCQHEISERCAPLKPNGKPVFSTRFLSGAIMTSFWWAKQRSNKWTCRQPVCSVTHGCVHFFLLCNDIVK